jgi:hypothetical protein
MPSSRLDSVEFNDRGMAQKLATENGRSPAARAMDEAIQLGMAGQSPYRDNATFVDAGEAWAGEAIKQAVDEARTVVLGMRVATTGRCPDASGRE